MPLAVPSPSLVHRAALGYAQRGWHVLPVAWADGPDRCGCGRADCRSIGKHPLTPHGIDDATTDPETIAEWWDRWPRAGVAIRTGAISGLWVLDVDGGEEGLRDLARVCLAVGEGPHCLTCETGGGGLHFYLRWPGSPRGNRTRWHGRLDTRGDRGYVIAPPTVHRSGRPYTWSDSGGRLGDPAWLDRALAWADGLRRPPAETAPPPRQETPPCPGRPDPVARARAYLERLPGAVSGQGGHGATFLAACALVRGFALGDEEALDLLLGDYNQRCTPEWSARELEHKIRQARARGTQPMGYLLQADASDYRGVAARPSAPQEEPPPWVTEEVPVEDPPAEVDQEQGEQPLAPVVHLRQEPVELLGFLPPSEPVARWVGWAARRAGRDGDLAGKIPADLRGAFTAGTAIPDEIKRPADVTEAQARRLRRTLRADQGEGDQREAGPCARIDRLVRSAVGGRATFSLTLSCDGRGSGTLHRLTGADLASYKVIRDLALECLIALPPCGKRARRLWDEALVAAMANVEEAPPEPEEHAVTAIADEILAILLGAEIGETEADVHRGLVVHDGEADLVYALPRLLVQRVRGRLTEDRPTREQIADAVRLLGGDAVRPLLSGGGRPRVWSFPRERLDQARSGR